MFGGGGLSLLSPQCPLYVCPELDAFEAGSQALELGLAGGHQRSNAALALQLARTWLQRRGYEGKAGKGGGQTGWKIGRGGGMSDVLVPVPQQVPRSCRRCRSARSCWHSHRCRWRPCFVPAMP